MEALNLLESFIQSAHAGSFSEAARRLGLTPAAVSKNVARLESQLGLRLFQRSTRSLTLTEGGRQFLQSVGEPFADLQDAIAHAAQQDGEPSGTLRVSVAVAFGRDYRCRCWAASCSAIRPSCRTGSSTTGRPT